jgi:DNA polymerase elongation subunit (family B)
MKHNKPKVLVFDIETSPNVVYCWRAGFKINIPHSFIIEEREVLCICWKWLGEKEVHSLSVKHGKGDKDILEKFSKVYGQADSVVAHNGDFFDIKWLRTRLLIHELPPLSNVHSCDTAKAAKNTFYFNSNKLDYISNLLLKVGKNPMEMQDWIDVMHGKPGAMDKMVKYCKQDVKILERVYKKLQPHLTNTVSHIAYNKNRDICPGCGSRDKQKYGIYYTTVGRYQKYRCKSCMRVWRDSRQLKFV